MSGSTFGLISNSLLNSFIGFEDIFNSLENNEFTKIETYPPFNYYKYHKEIWVDKDIESYGDEYVLEFALAGIDKNDIFVKMEDNCLSIEYIPTNKEAEGITYYHKGISNRNFIFKRTIDNSLKLESCKMENGLLRIVFKPSKKNSSNMIPIE